jgi:hypothetical protein
MEAVRRRTPATHALLLPAQTGVLAPPQTSEEESGPPRGGGGMGGGGDERLSDGDAGGQQGNGGGGQNGDSEEFSGGGRCVWVLWAAAWPGVRVLPLLPLIPASMQQLTGMVRGMAPLQDLSSPPSRLPFAFRMLHSLVSSSLWCPLHCVPAADDEYGDGDDDDDDFGESRKRGGGTHRGAVQAKPRRKGTGNPGGCAALYLPVLQGCMACPGSNLELCLAAEPSSPCPAPPALRSSCCRQTGSAADACRPAGAVWRGAEGCSKPAGHLPHHPQARLQVGAGSVMAGLLGTAVSAGILKQQCPWQLHIMPTS